MALKGSIGRNQSTLKPLERTLISLNWNQQAKEDKPHHCGKYNCMKYVSLDDWILLLHVINIKTYFFFLQIQSTVEQEILEFCLASFRQSRLFVRFKWDERDLAVRRSVFECLSP